MHFLMLLKYEPLSTNLVKAEADCCLKQGGIRETKGYSIPTFSARGVLERSKLDYESAIATELACVISQTKCENIFLIRAYIVKKKMGYAHAR